MATMHSKPPSFFNFLKEGLLLPTNNRRLFAAVFAIIVASSYLLRLLGIDDAVQPITDEQVGIDFSKPPLNGTDTAGSQEFHRLVREIMDDTRKLLFTGAVDGLVCMSIGSVTQIAILFAAVATYSGELLTFASLLGKAKAKLTGPLLTLAFVYVLEVAHVVLLVAMTRVLTFVTSKLYGTTLFRGMVLVLGVVAWVLVIIALSIFLVYFSFVCSLSVVVAVAEPGCHSAGAVGQAWRLMKGKLLRAMLFMAVTFVLDAAVGPVLSFMASGLLRWFLYTILMTAVQVFDFCTKTAFYYECKGAPIHQRPWCLPKTR